MTDMQEQAVEEMTRKVVELLETNNKKGMGWIVNKLVTKWAKVVETYFNGDNADALQVILPLRRIPFCLLTPPHNPQHNLKIILLKEAIAILIRIILPWLALALLFKCYEYYHCHPQY